MEPMEPPAVRARACGNTRGALADMSFLSVPTASGVRRLAVRRELTVRCATRLANCSRRRATSGPGFGDGGSELRDPLADDAARPHCTTPRFPR
jgi:hypothetical protein